MSLLHVIARKRRGTPPVYPRHMGVNTEHRAERGKLLPDSVVPTLIGIIALIGVYYAFQGIHSLVALASSCGSCAARPAAGAPFSSHLVSPLTPRTSTPTTAQIVPLPSNNNCPSCIPQPSFGPAP
jgi:hypothetical protein